MTEAEEIARQRAAWEQACEDACVDAQEKGMPIPIFDDFKPKKPCGSDT